MYSTGFNLNCPTKQPLEAETMGTFLKPASSENKKLNIYFTVAV